MKGRQQDFEFFRWLKENFHIVGNRFYYLHLPENNEYSLDGAYNLYLKLHEYIQSNSFQ